MAIPIIGDLINTIGGIVEKAIPDADKKIEVQLELAKLADQAQARLDAQMTAQVEVNKIEAQSGSVFVAGWRPAIGWVGAAALLYSYILSPFLNIFLTVPKPDYDGLYNIIIAMLGIGAMRTFEKVKGVSTNTMQDVPNKAQPTAVVPEVPKPVDKPKHRWQKI